MPFSWNYGGPNWAATGYANHADAGGTGAFRLPLGNDRLLAGDSEATGTYRSLQVIRPDTDGTRGQR